MNNNNIENRYNEETKQILDLLYQKAPDNMKLSDGSMDEIPASGNLGLISLGFEGLLAVRKKREKYFGCKIVFPILDYKKERTKVKSLSKLRFDVKHVDRK
ncbi:MAG: hypothetical protein JXR50_08650 [Prolixibacteraceae bacterium]|nr:hypothetical protein [Prolixibacteraceae bacterium]MBN2649794.1 hypothetical protein [Prolixibacteraceae bacterium]